MLQTRKTSLITGASAGLGVEYARLFARDGYDLVLVARRGERLEELAGELEKKYGITALVLVADLRESSAPQRIFDALAAAEREIDFLVNSAGFGTTGAFVNLDTMRELDLIDVNIRALTHLTRLFLPGMVARKRGRVLNIASIAGFVPGPYMATYYASKAFVLSLTEALAYELHGTGVTATASCPGPVETEFGAVSGNGKSVLFAKGGANASLVALHGYRAMHAGEVIAIPGLKNKLAAQAIQLGPRAASRASAARLNLPVRRSK